MVTVESVHEIHTTHTTTATTTLANHTSLLRVKVEPPIYVLSSLEYPRYLGMHVPNSSMNVNVHSVR